MTAIPASQAIGGSRGASRVGLRTPASATAVLLLLLVMPAQAQDGGGVLSFPNGFSQARLEAYLTVAGPDAAELRAAIDARGNGNGNVSAAEATAYGRDSVAVFNASLAPTLRGNYTLDGWPPYEARVTDVAYEGAAGALDGRKVAVVVRANLRFAPNTGGNHVLLVHDTAEGNATQMTVIAPAGHRVRTYILDDGRQGTGGTLSPDRTTLSYAAPKLRLEFEPATTADTPGLGVGVVLVALAGLAMVRRPPRSPRHPEVG